MSQVFTDNDGGSGPFGPDKTYGVWGNTDRGYGVAANAMNGNGVQAGSVNGYGIVGTSQNSDALVGVAFTGGAGVSAQSAEGYGIRGTGGNIGVYAHNLNAGPAGNDVYLATKYLAGDFKGSVYIDGSATVTGDILLPNADCAEDFAVSPASTSESLEPGTVMVLDTNGTVRESTTPYDRRVAGVVSGAGGYRPGIVLDRRPSDRSRLPVALLGKVYCKVDARWSPVEIGDLLTTSPTPGHAMKASDRSRAFGSVIGKALARLTAGTELIPVLVALQ